MPVVTRQVGPEDWADWRLVRQRSLAEDSEAFASSVTMWTGEDDTEARWRERLADGPCFVAYDGETPVGMVAGRLVEGSAELISMWVAPEARRRGAGRGLVQAVVEWGGERAVSLRVMDGNEQAVRAYEQQGFVLQDGRDGEGCRRMVRSATPPPYRLVERTRDARLPDGFFRRFRRVGVRGVLDDLNRVASHDEVPGDAAAYGMAWQQDDQDTARWFPQGITTSADAYGAEPSGGMFEGHDVVMTSWYGHTWLGRRTGSRISVIDWHDEEPPRYRHVLLVEPRRWWGLHRLRRVKVHAGGIVWYGQHLFVTGSSSGVRVFRLDDIVRVANRWRTAGYRYVLPQLTVYTGEQDGDGAPMTYSFMSLDRTGDEDHLVAGEYGRKDGSHRLIRYAIDRDTELLRSDDHGRAVPTAMHDRQIVRMQGAVVTDGTWAVTSSNGEGLPGDLYVGAPGAFVRHRHVLPTGAEDITYLPQRHQFWTLTEWPGHRWVFAIDADRYLGGVEVPQVTTGATNDPPTDERPPDDR